MAHRIRSFTHSVEALEPRTLLSDAAPSPVDTASVAAEVSSVLSEQSQRPRVVYDAEHPSVFWEGVDGGQPASLDSAVRVVSNEQMIPSEEMPVVTRVRFIVTGDLGGLKIVTRTDGTASGRFGNWYATGLLFGLERAMASAYASDPQGGRYVIEPTSLPQPLDIGAPYDLVVEDTGQEAHMRIEREGQVIAEFHGSVPIPPRDGKVVVHRYDEQTSAAPITVTHGKELAPTAAMNETVVPVLPPEAVDAVFAHIVSLLTEEEELIPAMDATASNIEMGAEAEDERWALLKSLEYEGSALTSIERSRLYSESSFYISGPAQEEILRRHKLFGSNTGVNGDLQVELSRLLQAYGDSVGDMLQRGLAVALAERRGEDRRPALEGLQTAMDIAGRLRYLYELAVDFGVGLPDRNAILAESRGLLERNLDRLIANQQIFQEMQEEDRLSGDTAPAISDENRQLELNMTRGLREAMVYTASVIGQYSAEVRQEFETAVTNAGMNIAEIYAEAAVESQVLGTFVVIHESAPETSTFDIRTDSAAGQLLIGLIHRLSQAGSTLDVVNIAKEVESTTAIPWWKIAQAAQSANGNQDVLSGNLLGLFTDAGYPNLTDQTSVTAPQFLSTHQHKAEYRGEDMLVRFDIATAGKDIDHIFAYLIGHDGQIGDALPVEVNGLSVKIPAALMREKLGDQESAHVQVKIVAWFKGEGHEGRIAATTEGVLWRNGEVLTSENLSTAEMGTEQWQIENAILQRLYLPVDLKLEWHKTEGSNAHTGESAEAVDFNMDSGGDTDLGQPVFSAVKGVIRNR